MKKIVHVIDSLGRGGAETLLVSVVTSLPQFEHHVITFGAENAFTTELQQHKNVHLYRVGDFHVWRLPLHVLKLRSLIRKISPAVVHSQLFWSNVAARLATPKSIPLFFTNQSLQKHEAFRKKWQVMAEKLSYQKHHTLISVSEIVEIEYKEYVGIKGNHHVLYNIAGDNFFKGPRRKFDVHRIQCVNVARLHPQKNQRFLLESFVHLPGHISLDIYGKGPLEAELLSLKEEKKIENVHFKGLSYNVAELLESYDIFIMSSLYEGFSLALMEAMASGLPVIIPDTDLFREMGGDAAIYFNPNDTKALAAIFKTLTPEKLVDMSAKGFERATRLARKENHLKKLLEIYGVN